MKRALVLLMVFAIAALLVPACGGGGGGGGGGGDGRVIGSSNVLKPIALFTNDSYVDYTPGSIGSEAANVEEALWDMGHTVTAFAGTTAADFSDALSGKEVLVIPELENGDLNASLDDAARQEISSFVNDGGILVVFPNTSYNTDALLNATFGYSIVTTDYLFAGETLTYDPAGAAGTPFEDVVPETLSANDGTYPLDPASLPAGAKVILEDGSGNAALTYIPRGDGHIVLIGWDWWNGKPVGSLDEGWWGVLYRAVSLNADHIDACVIQDYMATTLARELLTTGQFKSVDTFDPSIDTPALIELSAYDAILVSNFNLAFADSTTLGNVVADYVDAGGGVVLGMYTYNTIDYPDWSLMGRFESDDYYAMLPNAGQYNDYDSLDSINYPSHPTMAAVQSLDVADFPDTPNVNLGATPIAWYSSGAPVLATREIDGVRRGDLGFPTVWNSAYNPDSDGTLLIANTLTWTADLPEPSFITNSTSPGLSIDNPAGSNCTQQSTIDLSGGPESISRVTVGLDITHTYIWDLTIYL